MYFNTLLVAVLAAQSAAAPTTSLVTTFEERGISALEKRDGGCAPGSYLLYNDGTKNICVGPLGIVAGIAVWAIAFVPATILASKGKEPCTPSTGTLSPGGKALTANPLSQADKVLTITQDEVNKVAASSKRDAMPDAEVSGDGYMSLAPRAETLDRRSTATKVYYHWAAHGGTNCGTQLSTNDFLTLINDHIGKLMVATGATCGQFVINNSNAYSLNLNLAFCDSSYCYTGCWYR